MRLEIRKEIHDTCYSIKCSHKTKGEVAIFVEVARYLPYNNCHISLATFHCKDFRWLLFYLYKG